MLILPGGVWFEKRAQPDKMTTCCGGIAQLVERLVRNEKARGSNPLTSKPAESMQITRVRPDIAQKSGVAEMDQRRVIGVSRKLDGGAGAQT